MKYPDCGREIPHPALDTDCIANLRADLAAEKAEHEQTRQDAIDLKNFLMRAEQQLAAANEHIKQLKDALMFPDCQCAECKKIAAELAGGGK